MTDLRVPLRRLLLGLAALLALVLPAQAHAVRSWTMDIKAHPTVFKANTEVDVPLYLVETRAPDVDDSRFEFYADGVRHLSFNFGSVHSRFVSFTPIDGFDARGKNVETAEGLETYRNRVGVDDGVNRVWVQMMSTAGVKATPDNSGITGRTEVLVGTLRIAVGPAIDVGGGKKIVLDVVLHDDPSGGASSVGMWLRSPVTHGDNWAWAGTGSMATKQIRFFTDGTEIEGIAPGDGGGDDSGEPPAVPPVDPPPPPLPGLGEGPGPVTGSGPGDASGPGPAAPGVSSAGFSGRLAAGGKASRSPFSVLTKPPANGAPVIALTLTQPVALTATLAKVGKNGKASRLKGKATVPKRATQIYLKLTGSWNKKRLKKGAYRMKLSAPGMVAKTVGFRVR